MTDTSSGYNIGAVSRLTGITRERIRIWERRYAAVEPYRDSANNRLYRQEDIDRLVAMRRLVDAGHAISQLARLSLSDLSARLAVAQPPPPPMPGHVLVLGPEAEQLATEWRAWGLPSIQSIPELADADGQQLANADQLVVALPAVTGPDVPTLLRLRRARAGAPLMLVYRFAPQRVLDQLTLLDIRTVKAPLRREDLAIPTQTPPTAARPDGAADYRSRQYTPAQLQRLADRAGSVACECPQHLADLVRELQAFEDYTLACEIITPADAALHREVYHVIARARSLAEDALGIIAAEEGFDPATI